MSDPKSIFARTIGQLKQVAAVQHKMSTAMLHEELTKIATVFSTQMYQQSRNTKERYLQSVMNYSKPMGLNLVAMISNKGSYGKPDPGPTGGGLVSIFLPEGAYGFAPSMRTQSGITFCPEMPNDSMDSCFVAKGYRVKCFNGNLGDTDRFVVTSPGSYDFNWHGFSKKTSSIRIEPDTISPAQYNALKQQADSTQSQLDY